REMSEEASRIDFAALYAGAADLALAIDAALDGWPAEPATAAGAGPIAAVPGLRALAASPRAPIRLDFHASTPYGELMLSGDGDDRHAGRALLIIDTGGNDTYSGAAATPDALHGISIALDLGGDDLWGRAVPRGAAKESAGAQDSGPASGCGVLGYGYLIDL